MKIRTLSVDPKLDLGLLLYPSFALPLFEVKRNQIVKLYGVCRGLTIYKRDLELIVSHYDDECIDYAEEVLGFWSSTSNPAQVVGSYREFVELLKSEYSWFGIATSSKDDIELFASIFLSQNTDFHINVVKWIQTIIKNYGSINNILNIDKHRIVNEVSNSYQVTNLISALKYYLENRDLVLSSSSDHAKRYLLKIKGIGPKVAHSYLVFVKKSTIYAPVDRNLISFLSRFEITSNLVIRTPRKDMCLKYSCNSCPINVECTYYRIRKAFGEYTAWVQTVAYVHNKYMCRLKLCNKCFLKQLCYRRERTA